MNPKASLKQRAYDHIRQKLMSGVLIGGSRISDAELAEEIGISRTPVREAIIQLETEGVIEQIPRFGSFIRMLSREELIHLYELREVLEGHNAAMAAERATPEEVRRLESYNQ
jgi:DNA-binding GntR family transcriptional regulator